MNYQETQTVKWSSKAQIGMMEMIMVMVVITILLVIGMVFYFKFSASSIEKTGETITEETAAVIVSTIVQLPEIECSYLGSRSTKTCADTIKLLALSEKDKEDWTKKIESIDQEILSFQDRFKKLNMENQDIYREGNLEVNGAGDMEALGSQG